MRGASRAGCCASAVITISRKVRRMEPFFLPVSLISFKAKLSHGLALACPLKVRCGAVCWKLNLQVGDSERSGIFKMPPAGSDHGSRIRILWASSFKGAVQEQDRTLSGIWLSVLPWGSFPLKRPPPWCQQHPSRFDYLSDFRPLKWLSQSLFFVSLQHFATVI